MTDVVNFFQNILMNNSISSTNGTNGTNRNNDSITDHAMKYKEYKKNKEKEKEKAKRKCFFVSRREIFVVSKANKK